MPAKTTLPSTIEITPRNRPAFEAYRDALNALFDDSFMTALERCYENEKIKYSPNHEHAYSLRHSHSGEGRVYLIAPKRLGVLVEEIKEEFKDLNKKTKIDRDTVHDSILIARMFFNECRENQGMAQTVQRHYASAAGMLRFSGRVSPEFMHNKDKKFGTFSQRNIRLDATVRFAIKDLALVVQEKQAAVIAEVQKKKTEVKPAEKPTKKEKHVQQGFTSILEDASNAHSGATKPPKPHSRG